MIQRDFIRYLISVLLLLSICILSDGIVSAQTKIQVITKSIAKKVSYTPEKSLKINGEKATINIQSWDNDYISVNISLTAKHPSKKTAEDDLKFIDYKVIESRNSIELSNFFTQEAGFKEIQSNLTAKFDIIVPRSCALTITNLYGSISLRNIKNNVNIELNFAQLSMNKVEGNIAIKSYYGDIEADNINSVLKIQSEMADMNFRNLSGTCEMVTVYGNINIVPNERLSSLNINSSRTSIQLLITRFDSFSFLIDTQYADIIVPKLLDKHLVKNMFRSQFQQINEKPRIFVNGKYSTVTLKNN